MGDCRLDVGRCGEGVPVVVLHGEYGSSFLRPFLHALSESHDVYVPHHPGWAGSSRPAYVRTIRDVALVQQEFLESLGKSAAVVGLSLGGWVANEIAITAPNLMSFLMLISPTGIKAEGRERREFSDIYVTETNERRRTFSSVSGDIADDAEYYLEVAKSEEAVARYCWSPYMHDPTLRGRLRRIQTPTTILSSSADRFVLNAESYYREYSGLIPGLVRHEQIAGVGHNIEEEQPELVVRILDEMMSNFE